MSKKEINEDDEQKNQPASTKRLKSKILLELERRGFTATGSLAIGKFTGSQIHIVDIQRSIRRRDFVVNLGVQYLGTPRAGNLQYVHELLHDSVWCLFRERISDSDSTLPDTWFDFTVERDGGKVSAVCDEVESTLNEFQSKAPTTADLIQQVQLTDDGHIEGPKWLLNWLLMGGIPHEEVIALCAAHCGKRSFVEQLKKHFRNDRSEWYKLKLSDVINEMLGNFGQ